MDKEIFRGSVKDGEAVSSARDTSRPVWGCSLTSAIESIFIMPLYFPSVNNLFPLMSEIYEPKKDSSRYGIPDTRPAGVELILESTSVVTL